jgi:hypothetical protein
MLLSGVMLLSWVWQITLGFRARAAPFGLLGAWAPAIYLVLTVGLISSFCLRLVRAVRSLRAIEGLVVEVSDDGIERLYTAYFEDGQRPYEAQLTVKCKDAAAKLQSGDTNALILWPQGSSAREVSLYPLIAAQPTTS